MSRRSKRIARRIEASKKKTAAAARENPKSLTATGGLAKIQAADGDGEGKKLASFEGNAYTGAPMNPQGWWDPIIVDLGGVRVPSQHRPVLRQHDHNQIVGHTTAVKVTDAGIEIAGVFSGQPEHADKVTVPAKNGFQWQLSIGADPVRTEFVEAGETVKVNGRDVTGPIVISRETELGEISFVPLGADGETSATVAASKGRFAMNWKTALKFHKSQGMKAAAKYSDEEIEKMSEDEAKAALTKCMTEDDSDCMDAADESATDTEKKTEAGKKASVAAEVERGIKAARSAAAQEARRINEIHARAAKYGGGGKVKLDGKDVDIVPHAIEAGWSPDQVELHLLRSSRPVAPSAGPHVYVTNRPELSEAVIEAAVLQSASPSDFRLFDDEFYKAQVNRPALPAHITAQTKRELKSRYTDEVMQAAHTHFRGRIGLQQILKVCAEANGHVARDVDWSGSDGETVLRAATGRGIRADGGSSYSLSNLLANVLNKMMLAGYLWVEQSWRDISGIRPVKDFKPTKSINLFGDFMYAKTGPSGELQNATLGDQAFANQAEQYGRIFTIDRKAIINDDLGALTTVPMLVGRGAGLKLNDVFWTLWLSPGYDNGGSTNFFAATHTITGESGNSNYQSGAGTALSSTSLKAAKLLFDKQVDPKGYPLGAEAEILLYPPDLDQTAWELLNSSYLVMAGLASTSSASVQPSDNRWRGKYKPVMSRYLSNASYTGYSATAWYLLANPGYLAAIEVAFLNGVDMPTVQQAGIDYQFDRLGISIRGVFDFGVSMQNFRAAVKSAGA